MGGRLISPTKHTNHTKSVATPGANHRLVSVWFCLGVFGLVFLAFSPSINGGFLWDDDGHVTKPELRSVDGLRRIWFELGASQQYYPLLHSALWVQHRLWGDNTVGYHVVNLLLHATAACLLAAVLRRLLGSESRSPRVEESRSRQQDRPQGIDSSTPRLLDTTSRLAAVLFAVHPVVVESVAWISEQKNTLSAVFYLASFLFYLRFDELRSVGPAPVRPSSGPRAESSGLAPRRPDPRRSASGRPAYWIATALFICAALSKTVTTTLPAAILVALWWRRGRLEWRRDVLPLVPWFVFGIVAGLFTAWVERHVIGAEGWQYQLSLVGRCLLACRVIWFYLGKLAWPADLSFSYPLWKIDSSDPALWISAAGIAGLLAALLLLRKRNRAPLAGFLYFAGTLFPALGFFNVYPFRFSYVADHFQYLASIGIFVLASAGLVSLTTRHAKTGSRHLTAVAGALVVFFTALSAKQSYYYGESDRLWISTLARNPDSWLAHDHYALSLMEKGKLEEAMPHFETALRLNPQPSEENNIGIALQRMGRIDEAIAKFESAVTTWPDYVDAHNNLGAAYARVGRLREAIEHIDLAVSRKPKETKYRYNLALALRDSGDADRAAAELKAILDLEPDHAEALNALGNLHVSKGAWAAAIPLLERAVSLRPDSVNARQNLGGAYYNVGRFREAIPHFERALQLLPNQPGLERALATARQRAGE